MEGRSHGGSGLLPGTGAGRKSAGLLGVGSFAFYPNGSNFCPNGRMLPAAIDDREVFAYDDITIKRLFNRDIENQSERSPGDEKDV